MTCTLYFLVLLVSCVAIAQINGQEFCRPRAVQNVTLSPEGVLAWEQSPLEICSVKHYLIFILIGENEELIYSNDVTLLDVSFLPICSTARFTVTPISTQDVQGVNVALVASIPPPEDMVLSLTSLSLAQATNAITIQWDVTEQWKRCSLQFRVLIYNEDDDIPRDIYTRSTSETLNNLIPCTSYTFAVTPLYTIEREGHPSALRYSSPRAKIDAPELQRLNIGATTADLVWGLQRPTTNRCLVSSLLVDGSPSFNISYPILDQYNRPPVTMRLTNLQSDTMYVLRVSANNTAGLSNPFIVAVQTLGNN